MRNLLLIRAKRRELAASLDHAQHALGPDGAHELVLEVAHADEEPGAERTLERPRLAFVAEADGLHTLWQRGEHAPDRLRPADRHDRDAFPLEVTSEPRGERSHGDLVARAFDEDHA